MSEMNIHEVLKYLPHRYPFVLIDRVVEYQVGKSLVALKNVTINEQFFTGHFPHRPVMPGVLMLEALAQAAGILAFKTCNDAPGKGPNFLYAGIDNARFKHIVEPGDQLYLHVELIWTKRDIWKFQGAAKVANQIVSSAEMMLARRSES